MILFSNNLYQRWLHIEDWNVVSLCLGLVLLIVWARHLIGSVICSGCLFCMSWWHQPEATSATLPSMMHNKQIVYDLTSLQLSEMLGRNIYLWWTLIKIHFEERWNGLSLAIRDYKRRKTSFRINNKYLHISYGNFPASCFFIQHFLWWARHMINLGLVGYQGFSG